MMRYKNPRLLYLLY